MNANELDPMEGQEIGFDPPADSPPEVDSTFADLLARPIGVIETLARTEMDQQSDAAHKYGRSIPKFQRELLDIIGTDEVAAAACSYVLPRGGKFLEGESARWAEALIFSWGNCRISSRVVQVGRDSVLCQGTFTDIERGTVTTEIVERSIVGKFGRYNADMIVVTGNAGCRIASRNATIHGIPRFLWLKQYEQVRVLALGSKATLPARRDAAFAWFKAKGVAASRLLSMVGVAKTEDVDLKALSLLSSVKQAIVDGDLSVSSLGVVETSPEKRKGVSAVKARLAGDRAGEGAREAPKDDTAAPSAPTATSARAALSVALAKALGSAGVELMATPGKLSRLVGRKVSSLNDLSDDEMGDAINALKAESQA